MEEIILYFLYSSWRRWLSVDVLSRHRFPHFCEQQCLPLAGNSNFCNLYKSDIMSPDRVVWLSQSYWHQKNRKCCLVLLPVTRENILFVNQISCTGQYHTGHPGCGGGAGFCGLWQDYPENIFSAYILYRAGCSLCQCGSPFSGNQESVPW